MPETSPATVTSKGSKLNEHFSSAIITVVAESKAFREFRDELNPQGVPKHSSVDCEDFRGKAGEQLEENAKDPKKVPLWDPVKNEIKLEPKDDPLKPIYATARVMGMMRKSSLALMEKINASSSLGLVDLRQIMIYYNTIKALSEGTADITPCPDVSQAEAFLTKLKGIVKDPLVRLILAKDRANLESDQEAKRRALATPKT